MVMTHTYNTSNTYTYVHPSTDFLILLYNKCQHCIEYNDLISSKAKVFVHVF